jgi:hypothetical protein
LEKTKTLFTQEQFRLTALWALAETALGGFLHALKIPLTGFLVGGFAVLIIGLLALTSNNAWKVIIKATTLVLLMKAVASPHSPPMAYIAVAFQGIAGAICFSQLPKFIASYLFCIIAMLESALQKLIITTLVFGMRFWNALDIFTKDVLRFFHLHEDFSFSIALVVIFVGIYFIWGAILGHWLRKLPDQIASRKLEYSKLLGATDSPEEITKKKKKNGVVFFMAIVICYGFLFMITNKADGLEKAVYALLRSLFVVLFLYYIIGPVLQWILNHWLANNKDKHSVDLEQIIQFLPHFKLKMKPLYRHISMNNKGLKKYKEFVLALFVMAIYEDYNG